MFQRPPKRYAGEKPLDVDETRRRGLAVRAASMALATSAEAIAFLNEPHPMLGGRPIDIATASEAGLSSVKTALNGTWAA